MCGCVYVCKCFFVFLSQRMTAQIKRMFCHDYLKLFPSKPHSNRKGEKIQVYPSQWFWKRMSRCHVSNLDFSTMLSSDPSHASNLAIAVDIHQEWPKTIGALTVQNSHLAINFKFELILQSKMAQKIRGLALFFFFFWPFLFARFIFFKTVFTGDLL